MNATLTRVAPASAQPVLPTHMRAAVFLGDKRVEVREVPLSPPAPGQVLVRLQGTGVCASNLPVWAGKPWFRYPFEPGAPGHEGWGHIAALGAGVTGWRSGQRVALLSGHAYAEYDHADASALVALPETLHAQDVPGEPLACAMNILRRSNIASGQWVAVVGVGFIGAMLVQLASAAGARVLALSRRAHALEVARRCGAVATFSCADLHAATGAVQELTGGAGCACVIEAAGEQSTLDLASGLVATGGRLVIAGYHQDGARQVDMQSWNWRGIDVVNAHERDQAVVVAGMRAGISAVAEGRLQLQSLLTHRFSLDELPAAFEAMCDRPDGFLKALVLT